MSNMSDREIARNTKFADRAIAQPYLSGGRVSEETKTDLYRVARGEMTSNEALQNALRRAQNDPISE